MLGERVEVVSTYPRTGTERWLIDHLGVAVVDLDEAREIAHVYVQKA